MRQVFRWWHETALDHHDTVHGMGELWAYDYIDLKVHHTASEHCRGDVGEHAALAAATALHIQVAVLLDAVGMVVGACWVAYIALSAGWLARWCHLLSSDAAINYLLQNS